MATDPRDEQDKLTPKELDSVKLWQGKAATYKRERDAARTKVSELQTQLNHTKISVEGQKAITSMADDAERARCADIENLQKQVLELEVKLAAARTVAGGLGKELDDEKARVTALDSLHQTMMGHANDDRRAVIAVLKEILQPCRGRDEHGNLHWCPTPDSGNEFHQAQHRAGELLQRLEVYVGTTPAPTPEPTPAPENVAFVVSKPEGSAE